MAAATVPSPPRILWLLLISISTLLSITSASELSLVVSEATSLRITPSLIAENSPGSKPGGKVKCERVYINGLPRINHLSKFADSVRVNVSFVDPPSRPPNVHVCFHRNSSLGIGMCSQGQWERLTNGLWVKSMSPFDDKILDVRIGAYYSESLQVSLDEEFFWYRVLFLVFGIVLMTLASWLSTSLVFYYTGAMTVGVFLVVLMILFQGMKLLPTGRKSSLAIFLYSCFVGLGSFLLGYAPQLLRSLLVEIGLPEEMHNPVAIFLLVFLVITGAWLGFWVVRKLVLTEEGSIDIGVSHFVTWAIQIVASVMILQSSVDALLAIEAWVASIFVSFVLKKSFRSKAVRRAYKNLHKFEKINPKESLSPYTSPVKISRSSTRAPLSPTQGSSNNFPSKLSDLGTFYSTFHNTPDRRKFTKDEWNAFTRESTQQALEGLVSTPDFSKWAVANADRITLAPKKEDADKKQKWFNWF